MHQDAGHGSPAGEHPQLEAFAKRSSDVQRQRLRAVIAAMQHNAGLRSIAERRTWVPAESESDDDSGDEASPKKDQPRQDKPKRVILERPSLRTILDASFAVARYSFRPPRLIFVCGSEGKVLRTADRFRTWRAMPVEGSSTEEHEATITDRNVEVEEEGTTASLRGPQTGVQLPSERAEKPPGRDEVSAILSLLPPKARAIAGNAVGGARGSAIAAGAGATAAKQSRATRGKAATSSRDLFAIDTLPSGHVAACGARGTLLYSGNRGAMFRQVPTTEALEQLIADAAAGSDADSDDGTASVATSANLGALRALRHLVLVGERRVAVAAGPHVVLLELATASDGFAVRHARLLYSFKSDVRLLSAGRRGPGHTVVELIASAAHTLVMIDPDSEHRVEVAHSMGTILALVELPRAAIAKVAAPQPLKPSMTADLRSKSTKASAFSYASASIVSDESRRVFDASSTELPVPSADGKSSCRGRVFAAYCSGGRVVPYDWTCCLWLWSAAADEGSLLKEGLPPDAQRPAIVSSLSNADHMPFVAAHAKKDRVGIAVVGAQARRWVRSSPAGISLSDDWGATWTAPQHAFTGRCIAIDESEACVVCMKPAVATLRRRKVAPSGKRAKGAKGVARSELTTDWDLNPLPRNLRMAIVQDVALLE